MRSEREGFWVFMGGSLVVGFQKTITCEKYTCVQYYDANVALKVARVKINLVFCSNFEQGRN